MALKYGSTTVTALKYGSAAVDIGKYGSTVVFQTKLSTPVFPAGAITRTAGSGYTSFGVTATNNDSRVVDLYWALFSPSSQTTQIKAPETFHASAASGTSYTKSGLYASGYYLAYVGVQARKTNYADSDWVKTLAGIMQPATSYSISNASTSSAYKASVSFKNPNPVSAIAVVYLYKGSPGSGTSVSSTTVQVSANATKTVTLNANSSGTHHARIYFPGTSVAQYVTDSSTVNTSAVNLALAAKLSAPSLTVDSDDLDHHHAGGVYFDVIVRNPNSVAVTAHMTGYADNTTTGESYSYSDETFSIAANSSVTRTLLDDSWGIPGSWEYDLDFYFSASGYQDSDVTNTAGEIEDITTQ